MDIRSLLDQCIKSINDNNFNGTINLLSTNLKSLIVLFDDYLKMLTDNNFIDIATPFSKELFISNISSRNTDFQLVQNFRMIILYLLDVNKKLELMSSEQIYRPNTNIRFITIVGDTNIKVKLFVLYLIVFNLEAKLRRRLVGNNRYSHVGIDYEFNTRIIALMQICFFTFEDKSLTNSYIWIVNPGKFDQINKI